MILKRIPVGALSANCYLFGDAATSEIVIIDPGDEPDRIIDAITKDNLAVKAIAITHHHFDHIGALEEIKNKFNLQPVTKNFTVGKHNVEVIKTPGHSPDGLSFQTGKIVFTGDTLFNGSIGRYDLGGGDFNLLKKSILSLYKLPDETVVYPGHGLSTTIGKEKYNNPFIKILDNPCN